VPEKDLRDIKTVIRSLPPEQQWIWAREFGTGDRKDINLILSAINTPATELVACQRLKNALGIEVMTAEERKDYLDQQAMDTAVRATTATERQAAAAEEALKVSLAANQIAHTANEIAVHANNKAGRSLQVSFWNLVVAILAGVIALYAAFK
jgi:hypothetical protein